MTCLLVVRGASVRRAPGLRIVTALLPFCTLAAALASPPPAAAELPFVGVNPGAPIWNGSVLLNDDLAADIAGSGCRLVRVNFRIDGNATWTSEHLAKYDEIIAAARAHNLQILGLIAYEMLPGGQADWNENYDTTGMNPWIDDFADTAFMLIDRYKDDIKVWELWNEPSCWSVPPNTNPLNPGCFYLWPRNYARLMVETYGRCETLGGAGFLADNGLSFSTGGLFAHDIGGGYNHAMDYFSQVYFQTDIWNDFEAAHGRRYPWDYFGYHFYINGGGAVDLDRLASYFNTVRSWQTDRNDPSDILVTEFGWNTNGVSLQLQAENLKRTYDWLRTQDDIVAAMWYQWNNGDGGWGLTFSLGDYKPAYFEFAAQCGQVSAPAPNFAATPISGPAPLLVQFVDSTAGLVDSYTWDFGDAATSTAQNPTHTYAAPGTYTVSLTATGPGGADTTTSIDLITVTNPADFDGDGDGDLHDVLLFAECFGQQGPAITERCACEQRVTRDPQADFELAASIAALSRSILTDDVLAGLTGTAIAGGFHPATPGGIPGGLADLTDGQLGAGVEAVLADYSRPSLEVQYDLAAPTDLGALHVFSANSDGRVFQHYDVEVQIDGAGDFTPLATGVKAGELGMINDGTYGAGLTTLTNAAAGPLAARVTSLRVRFYDVSTVDPANVFIDPYDGGEFGNTDAYGRAYVGSIIKEIDVTAYAGPPLVTSKADLDADGDTDTADLELLTTYLAGPQ